MLQYSPDSFQWFMLTESSPLGFLLLILGLALLVKMAVTAYRKKDDRANYLKFGIPGVLLVAIGIFLPSFATTSPLADGVAKNLSSTANFKDVKLLHLETVSDTPFTEGSVVFVGTATDVDGDPRQFRYTQYADFGIYDIVGFDKPAVDLKDSSYQELEDGLDSRENDVSSSGSPKSSESPKATQTPKSIATPKATKTSKPKD